MKNKLNLPPIVWIGISAFLMFTIFNFIRPWIIPSNARISKGEQTLIKEKSNADKESGNQSLQKGDYTQAISHFEASLNKDHNDPESLIYLNNAKAGKESLKIAVVVPIDSNPNVSQEILRGVAQAQDEINKKDGVQGKKLAIVIANDDNTPEFSQQIATTLVEDKSILAVVGHNASNASLAAAPIYQKNGLVMISPTSFANNLSGLGSYIFRVVPSTKEMAKPLVDYAIKKAKKQKLAICYDSQAIDNVSFKDEFVANFLAKGGKLIPLVCDLSTPNFEPQSMINQAVQSGADGLLMTPHIDRIPQAIALAQANHNKLALFSSPTLYTIKTLELGQQNVDGLVIPIPWHPLAYPNHPFAQSSYHYWGGRINWRTAMAYDATLSIITGLQQNPTREGLQMALHSPQFTVSGATGIIKFLPSGDHLSPAYLSQVKLASTGYDFTLLKK